MRTCSRILAAIIVLFVIVALPICFFTYNTVRLAIDQQTYQSILDNKDFYHLALPLIIDGGVQNIGLSAAASVGVNDAPVPEVTNGFSANLQQSALDKLPIDLPVLVWLKTTVTTTLDNIFGWLNGRKPTLDLTVDMGGLKDWLKNTDSTQTTMTTLVAGLPACSADQETTLQTAIQAHNLQNVAACNPSTDALRTSYVTEASNALASYSAVIPASLNLAPDTATSPAQAPLPAGTLQLLTGSLAAIFLCPGALMFLVLLLAVRSGKAFFGWIGITLFLGGLLTAIPAWTFSKLTSLPSAITVSTIGVGSANNVVADRLAERVATLLAARLGTDTLLPALILVGVGFVFLILSLVVPARQPVDPNYPQEKPKRQG